MPEMPRHSWGVRRHLPREGLPINKNRDGSDRDGHDRDWWDTAFVNYSKESKLPDRLQFPFSSGGSRAAPPDVSNWYYGSFPEDFLLQSVIVFTPYTIDECAVEVMLNMNRILQEPLWAMEPISGGFRYEFRTPVECRRGSDTTAFLRFTWEESANEGRDGEILRHYGARALPDGTAMRLMLRGTEYPEGA